MPDPTLISFTATGSRILVGRRQRDDICSLLYGDYPTEKGIAFAAVVDVPDKCTGVFEWVQDVIALRKRVGGPKGGPECLTSRGQRVLDSQDPYLAPIPVAPGRYTLTADDSPSQPLPFWEKVDVFDQFRMFLMWTNDDTPKNRVVMGVIEWAWQATAEATGAPGDCHHGKAAWKRTNNGQSAGPWDTSGYPVLSPNLTDLKWQPC
jgi:hypothetical protein